MMPSPIMSRLCRSAMAALFLLAGTSTAFAPARIVSLYQSSSLSPLSRNHQQQQQKQQSISRVNSAVAQSLEGDAFEYDDDESPPPQKKPLDSMEQAWRYAKKPLLSIGAKGATLTHGNSLKQLLEQHTVVKVKVNTRRFDNSLEQAFETLKGLAEENGAPAGIELLQARESDHVILFGWPGTRKRIEQNEFPIAPAGKNDE